MTEEKQQKIAVVFVEDNYECLELHYPRLNLIQNGYKVHVVGPEKNKTYKSKEGYWAISGSEGAYDNLHPRDISVIIIPGGFCTDRLRRYPHICEFVKEAWNDGNGAVIGAICHAHWLAISAKILKGRRVTCFCAIKDDCENAGATVVMDERCVVDGRLVTAQTPEDLPAFMTKILEVAANVSK